MLSTATQKWNKSEPNKSLKHVQRVALNWTPSTGAASHCRAGFSRRLARRYASLNTNNLKEI
jgi:hypothetical protein